MSEEVAMINFRTHLNPDPPFYFGNRILHELGSLLKSREHDKVFLVTNELLFELYGRDIVATFDENSIVNDVVIIKDGEENKSFNNLESLCEALVGKGISKGSIIVGFGGGCLTNIVGLASALIFRGIRYVEMPSTMMGLTDSTLSNKQAVCGRTGKNQFGTYYAPVFIFGDTRFLQSESLHGKKMAIVEGIKNGFISDPHLLTYLEERLDDGLENYGEKDWNELTLKIIQSKLRILERDPSEKAYCMTLEYGHTFGHAMEFITKGKIQHGLAVAKGMCIAAELSQYLGYLSEEAVDMHYYLLGDKLGLDVSIPDEISVEGIMKAIRGDNKKTAMGVKYVLLEEIGESLNPDGDYQVCVEEAAVRDVLTAYKDGLRAATPSRAAACCL